ncbi:hypothetical protein KO505_16895 [Psychrosphaera sp. F3M07]|uniref:hypothetical protein n=1 Tax=Psychrosphaera sp. F3M07 TaxID=2841560 RepID=UPI001C089E28|nr:hypothetical protein [Psychrosphaera sp. F3M07]MBU2919627.1 hypothetical protein [Psychrosphaera sp. F3M07]
MKLFIEGLRYCNQDDLNYQTNSFNLFDSRTKDGSLICRKVGYICLNGDPIFILPKIFLLDLAVSKLACSDGIKGVPFLLKDLNESKISYIQKVIFLHIMSIKTFKQRNPETTILQEKKQLRVSNRANNKHQYIIELVLEFVNFYRKNKNFLLFNLFRHKSKIHKNVNWSRTVSKEFPAFTDEKTPIYFSIRNSKKEPYYEEELLVLFYSILTDMIKRFGLSVKIESPIVRISGKKLQKAIKSAPYLLRKIQYRYFSDIEKSMFSLVKSYCELSQSVDESNNVSEYLVLNSYDIIFEDMVDYLISDSLINNDLKALKYHPDGKQLDHIYLGQGLFDVSEEIHYIGDSKYYKVANEIDKGSVFKQFTYARNIQAFYLSSLKYKNKVTRYIESNKYIKYKDKITKGYNVIPNFFIRAGLHSDASFSDPGFSFDSDETQSFYQEYNNLHDANTYFILSYNVNYLYLLSSYANRSSSVLLKTSIQQSIRSDFVKFMNNNFVFYKKEFISLEQLEEFVQEYFFKLNGKIYRTNSNPYELILSTRPSDIELNHIFDGEIFKLV